MLFLGTLEAGSVYGNLVVHPNVLVLTPTYHFHHLLSYVSVRSSRNEWGLNVSDLPRKRPPTSFQDLIRPSLCRSLVNLLLLYARIKSSRIPASFLYRLLKREKKRSVFKFDQELVAIQMPASEDTTVIYC